MLKHNGIIAYADLFFPPYVGFELEVCEKALDLFIQNPVLSPHLLKNFGFVPPIENTLTTLLIDYQCKLNGQSVFDYLQIPKIQTFHSCFTIGIKDIKALKSSIEATQQFPIIKFKIGKEDCYSYLRQIEKYRQGDYYIDTNQGWDKEMDLEQIGNILSSKCTMIEQPFDKAFNALNLVLKKHTKTPIIADESFQTIEQLSEVAKYFDGINIKLSKCGGLLHALQTIKEAQKHPLKIMIGCMASSSINIGAASVLASYADYIDLDAPALVNNDAFSGITYNQGVINNPALVSFGISPTF